jgi:hypothetical protein
MTTQPSQCDNAKAAFISHYSRGLHKALKHLNKEQAMRLAESAYGSHAAYDEFLRNSLQGTSNINSAHHKLQVTLHEVLAELSLVLRPVQFRELETALGDLEDLAGLAARQAPKPRPTTPLSVDDVQTNL